MKVAEKRRLKKIAIMEAALEVWSRDDYASTSLTGLAAHLGMTKPALYRYFKNKNALLDEMNIYVAELHKSWFSSLKNELEALPDEQRLPLFIQTTGQGIKNNIRYSQFDSYNSLRMDESSHGIYAKEYAELASALNIPERLLHLIILFCYFIWGWHEGPPFMPGRRESKKAELIRDLIENGFAGPEFSMPERAEDFSKSPGFLAFRESMEKENMMVAVKKAIQEKGFQGVTLESIAEKAGISKSTLYNYFKNKDEMLTKTVNALVKEYVQFHSQLLAEKETFEDKLLAHLEMQGLMFPGQPRAFAVMKQFMSKEIIQKLRRPAFQPEFLSFIAEGIQEGKLRPLLGAFEYQMVFSLFIIIEQIVYKREGSLTDEILEWLELMAYGTKGMSSVGTRSKA